MNGFAESIPPRVVLHLRQGAGRIVGLLLLSIPVRAEPLPMPKCSSGGCPYGGISNGSPHKRWITGASTLAPTSNPSGDQRRLGATTADPT